MGLRERIALLEDLLDNATDLIQRVTPDGKLVFTNRAWREALGYSSAETEHLSMFDIIHPDSQAHCMEMFGRVLGGETVSGVEAVFVARDGRAITVEGNVNCQFENGKPASTRGIFRDISERKRAEEERDRFFVLSRDLMSIGSLDGRLRRVNPAWERLLGFTPEELVGVPLWDLVHPDDREPLEAAVQVLMTATDHPGPEFRLRCKDGSYRWIHWAASAIPAEGLIYAIGRDITVHKKVDAALRQTRDQLEHRVKERTAELEEANQRLRESEERQRAVSELVSDYAYAFRVEADGVLVPEWVTDSVPRMTGFSLEEVTRLGNWQSLLHPEDLPRLAASATRLRQEGVEVLEFRIVTKEGQTRWLRNYMRAVRGPDRRIVRLYGAAQDITEQRQVEEEVSRLHDIDALASEVARDLLKQPAEEISAAIVKALQRAAQFLGADAASFWEISTDRQMFRTVSEWHDADVGPVADLPEEVPIGAFRWLLEQLVTRDHLLVRRLDELPEQAAVEKAAALAMGFRSGAHFCTRSAGEVVSVVSFHWRRHEAAVDDTDLVRIGVLVETLRTALDRARAQTALAESERRYRDLFDNATDLLYTHDLAGNFTSINRACEHVLGYSREEALTMNFAEVLVPGQERMAGRAVERLLADEGLPRDMELEVRAKDGRRVIVDMNPRLIVREGKPVEIHGIARDITARKRAEEALQEEVERHAAELETRVEERTAELEVAKEQAESADRLKSAFLATMSHELRTPLNSIIGFTGVILQGLAGPLTGEQTKQLGMVGGSARHLLTLINDVLDISKIEAGQLEIRREPFDMRACVTKTVDTMRPLAEQKGLALRAQLDPDVGRVLGDSRRVEQVLLNLLSNAVKFTLRGEITLACELGNGTMLARVSDTGIGIDPVDLAKLFKPFQQVDMGLTRQHEGTGLGLAICRRLVELMGGRIWVESEPGLGSTFSFTLPLSR